MLKKVQTLIKYYINIWDLLIIIYLNIKKVPNGIFKFNLDIFKLLSNFS